MTDREPRGTDWDAYGPCPICLVDEGRQCKSIVPRKGQQGLGHQGQPGLEHPHNGRPKKEKVAEMTTTRVVRWNRKANTYGPVLEFLGTNVNGRGDNQIWLCCAGTGGPAFPVKEQAFTDHYVAFPIREVPEPAPAVTGNYTVVYARGVAHLEGLDEVPRDYGTEDAPAYTYSACSALTTNKVGWNEAWYGTDLADALEHLESIGKHRATGVCKTCGKKAREQLEKVS